MVYGMHSPIMRSPPSSCLKVQPTSPLSFSQLPRKLRVEGSTSGGRGRSVNRRIANSQNRIYKGKRGRRGARKRRGWKAALLGEGCGRVGEASPHAACCRPSPGTPGAAMKSGSYHFPQNSSSSSSHINKLLSSALLRRGWSDMPGRPGTLEG